VKRLSDPGGKDRFVSDNMQRLSNRSMVSHLLGHYGYEHAKPSGRFPRVTVANETRPTTERIMSPVINR